MINNLYSNNSPVRAWRCQRTNTTWPQGFTSDDDDGDGDGEGGEGGDGDGEGGDGDGEVDGEEDADHLLTI